jgi:hypothetical protein
MDTSPTPQRSEPRLEHFESFPIGPVPVKDVDVWSVGDLLRIPKGDSAWIIEGLLPRGGQMLLAAPPKSGKSLLASEIALALALPFRPDEKRYLFNAQKTVMPEGKEEFPGLLINPAPLDARLNTEDANPSGSQAGSAANHRGWRVLVLSLEMREAEVAMRVRRQLAKFRIHAQNIGSADEETDELKIPLKHIFGLPEAAGIRSDLEIIKATDAKFGEQPKAMDAPDFNKLRDLIMELKPEVVIIDTLIQLHSINENDNILMKGLMRALRRLAVVNKADGEGTEPVAHIVLHHTRKESAQFYGPLSPEIMRGAGSIHGVADLVMLARKIGAGDLLEVHISSRNSSIPNFHLRRDEYLTHEWKELTFSEKKSKPQRIKEAIKQHLASTRFNGRIDLEMAKTICTAVQIKPQSLVQYIGRMIHEMELNQEIHVTNSCTGTDSEKKSRANQKPKWEMSAFAIGPQPDHHEIKWSSLSVWNYQNPKAT